MYRRALTVATAALAGRLALAGPLTKRALDTDSLANKYFGNDADWYRERIPYFESSDKEIEAVFYYRWKIFRAHQRDLGERGYVSTEFLDDVGWQLEPWATLNDATGFHLGEGRWLRDRRFADDYIRHMYNGGNDRHFTDYMSDSVYGRYLVDGDVDSMTVHLDAMTSLYSQWEGDSFDTSKGLFWREPLADATEYTISSIDASCGEDGFGGGQAFRPSINSYQWANAIANAKIAELAGRGDVASTYNQKAATLKERFDADIWNQTMEHYIDRHQRDTECVKYYEPIRGRELVGLVPWMFNMPDNNDTYSQAWKHLLNPEELRGSSGMRTVEPSYEYYMRQYRYDTPTGLRECQWNGPVWPYQTTQVLLGLANLLDTYDQDIISKSDYLDELRRYTKLHYQGDLLDLEEDYEPDKPGPIVGLPRSHHYFHSGYNDLIIGGLVGIRPQPDNSIIINPMIPTNSDISYFRLQDVPYHGHTIAVQWRSGTLQLEVDGNVVASSQGLNKLTAQIASAPAPAIKRPIAKSVQLVRGQFPIGSASSGNETENVHDAIDGRVWFFPELKNGWDSDATDADSEQFYQVDFGSDTSFTSVELAFFADDGDYVLPSEYKLQQNDGGSWSDIWTTPELIANGVTTIAGDAVETSQLRVSFTQLAGKRTRLAEFKAY
ncbi:hypothetical protein CLAFUW4_09836 [Fulvia fulva]|uniref:F5/8 type C domain-containing protein n=1 Tax=Passalora fulva TaxID=5499 RepID=A0A9Q8PIB3_PASFU|nr:uncharacterized protein CLAFUR5_12403 [Fulvia fulva]KAK4616293.1 hypothetical protein CLAFUR4_09842 [Fulvia fulva]KAK4616483.1 hypothetical protein CLAFUR0_09835 [Fulvia fulva]UJO22951.1 hypothetical protein CLAFUR5_12403 [Fulvia fulva]WPV18800.1 hypothetical protein CLAFUW4_09836 [Fulvia fulva]WPV33839.1 hypothetical protein CLAFUW7_09839 [Fulvia fulva]